MNVFGNWLRNGGAIVGTPNMLTRQQINLLWAIDMACTRCIFAAKCFDIVSDANKNVWAFTQNCYGGICVIHWCQVFGACKEPTHYSRLFDEGSVSNMTKEEVSNRLRGVLGMNESEYLCFWETVKQARDKYLVHDDFADADRPTFPDSTMMLKTSLEMRDILRHIIDSESIEDEEDRGVVDFVSRMTNDRYLLQIDNDVQPLVRAVSEAR